MKTLIDGDIFIGPRQFITPENSQCSELTIFAQAQNRGRGNLIIARVQFCQRGLQHFFIGDFKFLQQQVTCFGVAHIQLVEHQFFFVIFRLLGAAVSAGQFNALIKRSELRVECAQSSIAGSRIADDISCSGNGLRGNTAGHNAIGNIIHLNHLRHAHLQQFAPRRQRFDILHQTVFEVFAVFSSFSLSLRRTRTGASLVKFLHRTGHR